MTDQGWRAWLRSETPNQIRRRERSLAHPVRTAVGLGAYFGTFMGLLFLVSGASVTGAVIYGLALGAFFGPSVVVFTRHQQRNRAHEGHDGQEIDETGKRVGS